MSDPSTHEIDFDAEEAAGDDREPGSTRKWWIVGILGCTLALGLVVWFAVSATYGRVSWQTTGYDVVDAEHVEVAFTIHRPANVAVVCQLKAMDQAFAAVGLLDVTIPAGPEIDLARRVTIRTTTLAVTGTVATCHPS